MESIGKALVAIGLVTAVVGGALWGLARLGFRGLPGDLRYESPGGGLRFYFPIVTSLVLSIGLSLLWWLWRYFTRR